MGATSDPPVPISVLHVDGYPPLTALSAELLERAAPCLAVERARTPGAVVDAVRAGGVDCVVSGYDLPGPDGVELLDRVRRVDPRLPFVLFTASRDSALRREVEDRAATAVLRKETDPESFAALADRVVGLVSTDRDALADRSPLDVAAPGDGWS